MFINSSILDILLQDSRRACKPVTEELINFLRCGGSQPPGVKQNPKTELIFYRQDYAWSMKNAMQVGSQFSGTRLFPTRSFSHNSSQHIIHSQIVQWTIYVDKNEWEGEDFSKPHSFFYTRRFLLLYSKNSGIFFTLSLHSTSKWNKDRDEVLERFSSCETFPYENEEALRQRLPMKNWRRGWDHVRIKLYCERENSQRPIHSILPTGWDACT